MSTIYKIDYLHRGLTQQLKIKAHIGDIVSIRDTFYVKCIDEKLGRMLNIPQTFNPRTKKWSYARPMWQRGFTKKKWRVIDMLVLGPKNVDCYSSIYAEWIIYVLKDNEGNYVCVRYDGISKNSKIDTLSLWPNIQELRDNFYLRIIPHK